MMVFENFTISNMADKFYMEISINEYILSLTVV